MGPIKVDTYLNRCLEVLFNELVSVSLENDFSFRNDVSDSTEGPEGM